MKALLEIYLGKDAKNYIKIMDMPKDYKRSKIRIKEEKGKISIEIDSNDAVAMIASLNSIIKQFRVISSIGKVVESFH
ncbi:MAG: KEOPS complex subunit Pcc1 [Candidatus Micrarchaeia archaeon]|mgnify:CR=1 FL=1